MFFRRLLLLCRFDVGGDVDGQFGERRLDVVLGGCGYGMGVADVHLGVDLDVHLYIGVVAALAVASAVSA